MTEVLNKAFWWAETCKPRGTSLSVVSAYTNKHNCNKIDFLANKKYTYKRRIRGIKNNRLPNFEKTLPITKYEDRRQLWERKKNLVVGGSTAELV
jgi:hypothetical protein